MTPPAAAIQADYCLIAENRSGLGRRGRRALVAARLEEASQPADERLGVLAQVAAVLGAAQVLQCRLPLAQPVLVGRVSGQDSAQLVVLVPARAQVDAALTRRVA